MFWRWPHLQRPSLADPTFGTSVGVDVFLEADAWSLVVESGLRSGQPSEPYAQATRFGCVVLGPAQAMSPTRACSVSYCAFWWGGATLRWDCLRSFLMLAIRRRNITAPASLPTPILALRMEATSCISCTAWRLACGPELWEKCVAFMREYENLGHMLRVDSLSDQAPVNYFQCLGTKVHRLHLLSRSFSNASVEIEQARRGGGTYRRARFVYRDWPIFNIELLMSPCSEWWSLFRYHLPLSAKCRARWPCFLILLAL